MRKLVLQIACCTYSQEAKHGGWLGRRRDPIGHTILMRRFVIDSRRHRLDHNNF